MAEAGCPATEALSLTAEQVSLFHRLGGHAAVAAAVDVFYKRITADSKLSTFFDGVDMTSQRRKQAQFMTYVFGGPERYAGRDLHTAHKRLIDEKGLNEDHFMMVAGHLAETLKELNVPQALIDEAIGVVATARPLIFGQV